MTKPDNILTVTGNYTAASDLVIDTFLNDGVIDITDQMLIGGNATGQTNLTVNVVPGSPGGLTGMTGRRTASWWSGSAACRTTTRSA